MEQTAATIDSLSPAYRSQLKWRAKNIDRYNAYHREYRKKRLEKDPNYSERLRDHQRRYRAFKKATFEKSFQKEEQKAAKEVVGNLVPTPGEHTPSTETAQSPPA